MVNAANNPLMSVRRAERAKPSGHVSAAEFGRSLIDDPVARCARAAAARPPGEADISIVRHRRSPRPPELHRRPDPPFAKRNRRSRKEELAAPPSRLERVARRELDAAARSRARERSKWLTRPIIR